jgi:hypothetical protein
MIPISLKEITITTLQVIYRMYIGEIFYDSKTETRWEKVAKKLSGEHPKGWTPDASEVEAIYKEVKFLITNKDMYMAIWLTISSTLKAISMTIYRTRVKRLKKL